MYVNLISIDGILVQHSFLHSMHLRDPGSMLGCVGPSHDPLSHQLYCRDCPQAARFIIIPWARGAAAWHKIEAITLLLQGKLLTPS